VDPDTGGPKTCGSGGSGSGSATLDHSFIHIAYGTPQEFTDLQKNTNEELTKCCDNFFDLLDNFAETKNKHRHAIWPLQIMLLILTPKVSDAAHTHCQGQIMQLVLTPKVSEQPCLGIGAKSLVRSLCCRSVSGIR
jgi:hypothetical protein